MAAALIIFIISVFIVFYAMVGYPLFLILLKKIKKSDEIAKDYNYEPTVTYMIAAHNEEKVIEEKLENALTLDYPAHRFDILIASDHSTDQTNEMVKKFIKTHADRSIRLYCSKEHKGKTNAQNEAQKIVDSEILVMSDANTILNADAIRELVSCFTGSDIVYVCGKLLYSNSGESATSNSESAYWSIDLKMRDIESRIQTITAGNGAIYACRNSEYVDFAPIKCHDSAMPFYYGIQRKRALFNPKAIAVEKAGETNEDEFKRKVRMNRNILQTLRDSFQTVNIFKLKWFSLFYFGHRTCRYLLWLGHLSAFIASIVMACKGSIFGMVAAGLQLIVIILTLSQLRRSFGNRYIRMLGYYGMTVLAQYVGVYRIVTGKAKPTWEKAESTR